MTARIAGFVTRSSAGLRGPKSISRNITPAKGGVAIHYGGPRQTAADPGSDHSRCVSTWLAWQRYHMDTHGWVDIAYTGGFCNHGFAFAGRGAGLRTAANGTNAGNQNYYAVVWIGGDGQTPTQAALDAADWWVSELRQNGSAGQKVKPHRFFTSTGCPGDSLVGYSESRDSSDVDSSSTPTPAPSPNPTPNPAPKPGGLVFTTVTPGATGQNVKNLQGLLVAAGRKVTMDGICGPLTIRAVREYQTATGLAADGLAGTDTFRRLLGV